MFHFFGHKKNPTVFGSTTTLEWDKDANSSLKKGQT